MSALTQARMTSEKPFKYLRLPLATGVKAWQGGIACVDTSTNTCKPGVSGNANLLKVGEFAETVDNTSGGSTVSVNVNFDREINARWYDNAAGGAAVTALFTDCYIADDHTVTSTSTSNSKAGRVWAIDAVKGVLVEQYTL